MVRVAVVPGSTASGIASATDGAVTTTGGRCGPFRCDRRSSGGDGRG
ncbi:hypothetical protein Ae168Ps1_1707c [Pseudonocardia sp. Ae168_Ps1]|nr:hypothetical protein Ae150APs1_1701c [Pseudonocardia sp. Ae150A_Ps1]OLL79301.1 hypothetical protein Ae168Ps1_1707c [Pseudonocardia sp. Ae168_Ps1]OLL86561.1 hypothetical protein Ae263Ps1_3616 [Pseudonocardia sp. Ae263_Ps1]